MEVVTRMDVQVVSQLVGQLGFPIFVAIFMLVKQSKDTENMSKVLAQLQVAIEHLSTKLDKEG